MNRLSEIIANKRKEVEAGKNRRPLSEMEAAPGFNRARQSLISSLQESSRIRLIAEFKRKSPSRGWFKAPNFSLQPVVCSYEAGGAVAASVLTDEHFFGGNIQDLSTARAVTQLPLLRKDFIIDRWQIAEARAAGADVVLLIAACLAPEQLKELSGYAKSIGLETLLEIHSDEELHYIDEEIDMVGINNRDLRSFEVNLETSFRLVEKIKGKPVISESRIGDAATVIGLENAGFRACLIGEQFMKEPDPGQAFRNFAEAIQQKTTTGRV